MFEKIVAIFTLCAPIVLLFMSILSWFSMQDGLCSMYAILSIVTMFWAGIYFN